MYDIDEQPKKQSDTFDQQLLSACLGRKGIFFRFDFADGRAIISWFVLDAPCALVIVMEVLLVSLSLLHHQGKVILLFRVLSSLFLQGPLRVRGEINVGDVSIVLSSPFTEISYWQSSYFGDHFALMDFTVVLYPVSVSPLVTVIVEGLQTDDYLPVLWYFNFVIHFDCTQHITVTQYVIILLAIKNPPITSLVGTIKCFTIVITILTTTNNKLKPISATNFGKQGNPCI
eukprot:TRINITY_DN6976_c0_g1_i2.p1 TRINITY_DN6976_c0_g1~~TRINITY_DN6976_c0_g1_i2.p1  ORF type:complete len:230 (-),score=9.08 TRINITY_DN6976_c0_g1_i2:914-1603(-)